MDPDTGACTGKISDLSLSSIIFQNFNKMLHFICFYFILLIVFYFSSPRPQLRSRRLLRRIHLLHQQPPQPPRQCQLHAIHCWSCTSPSSLLLFFISSHPSVPFYNFFFSGSLSCGTKPRPRSMLLHPPPRPDLPHRPIRHLHLSLLPQCCIHHPIRHLGHLLLGKFLLSPSSHPPLTLLLSPPLSPPLVFIIRSGGWNQPNEHRLLEAPRLRHVLRRPLRPPSRLQPITVGKIILFSF